MKILGYKLCVVILFFAGISGLVIPDSTVIDSGSQPQISIDPEGTIRIIYGLDEKILYVRSDDDGLSFSDPQLIGEVKEMHLGMSRGPQIASSSDYTLVTAMDKSGNIHSFQLRHKTGIWERKNPINDISGSAPEGLLSIAADSENNFYAVWLDVRDDLKNKIYFSSTNNAGESWTRNQLAYTSPEGTVCECCQPSIAVRDSHVFIMFRNWLNGSRDLYLLESKNDGSFGDPVKLGTGTWKLNACPMDGGGLVAGQNLKIHTVWQRKGEIYYSTPGETETRMGSGRNCDIAGLENPIITWQEGTVLKAMEIGKNNENEIGEGSFIKAQRMKDNGVIFVWENNGKVYSRKL